MFSCEMCGEGLRGYEVTFTDFEKAELCEDCTETMREDGKVLLASRFVGLKG